MSIWCSRPHIGFDEFDDEPQPSGGQVRSYATGWSNHYPDLEVEQPAVIETAHVAPWCVPGHWGSPTLSDNDRRVGPWLRLMVVAPAHNFHQPTEIVGQDDAAVVMDEDAVRALVAELQGWLDMPKVYPVVAS